VPQAFVVWDGEGDEVFRNLGAQEFEHARHANAIAASAIDDALRSALEGRSARRDLDLFGPPRRVLTVNAVPVTGRALGAIATVEDVSERRRLEGVRRDFVANVSHELKTPVGALGVLAETIVAEDEPTVIRRLAERMTGEAIRVGRLIDDLLVLSRIESEEQPPLEPVVLTEVVIEAAHRVTALAESNDIAVDTSDVTPGLVVRGDGPQLVSALGNLLENACKYSDAGTDVRVRTSQHDGWVDIEVADRGIGIPTRDLERIFERFYRVDRARSRVTGGTGLGLSIVRHIARSHGGDISVTSREGEGSTFILRLPSGSAHDGTTPTNEQEASRP
jgi:two-component system sensor histidine kinase SenX3